MIDWTKGFTSQYYVSVIDPVTWRDRERIEIVDGSITKNTTGLLQSADVTCVKYVRGLERWLRIYLIAKQNDETERVALFTGLDSSPDREINGTYETNPVQIYSVLKPADDVLLSRGWYAPAAFVGADLVKQLLSVSPAPIKISDNSPRLQSAIIAEDGETNLSMAHKILKAINWRIKLSGDGIINIVPKSDKASYRLDTMECDIVEPKITVKRDWYQCPNVFRAIEDDLIGIARDDSPDSPLSTVNRGREVWAEDTNCDLNDGESVAEYAIRRLKEEQSANTIIEYDRRFVPDIEPTDLLALNFAAQEIDGTYEIMSQSITLGHGAKVSEEVNKYER